MTAMVAPWANDVVEQIIEICRGYVASKRAGGMLDFDDLLLLWRAAALEIVWAHGLRVRSITSWLTNTRT